jgi:hypothetical protein
MQFPRQWGRLRVRPFRARQDGLWLPCSAGPIGAIMRDARPPANDHPRRDARLPRLATGLMQKWIHGLS